MAHNQLLLFHKEIYMGEGILGNLPYKLECINHKEMVSNRQNIPIEQVDRIDVPRVQIPEFFMVIFSPISWTNSKIFRWLSLNLVLSLAICFNCLIHNLTNVILGVNQIVIMIDF